MDQTLEIKVGRDYLIDGTLFRIVEERPVLETGQVVKQWVLAECGLLGSLVLGVDGRFTMASHHTVIVGVTVALATEK